MRRRSRRYVTTRPCSTPRRAVHIRRDQDAVRQRQHAHCRRSSARWATRTSSPGSRPAPTTSRRPPRADRQLDRRSARPGGSSGCTTVRSTRPAGDDRRRAADHRRGARPRLLLRRGRPHRSGRGRSYVSTSNLIPQIAARSPTTSWCAREHRRTPGSSPLTRSRSRPPTALEPFHRGQTGDTLTLTVTNTER